MQTSELPEADTAKYVEEVDSLGHSKYYTYPDIKNISVLKDILTNADAVYAFNFNGHNANSANVECDDLFELPSNKLCPSATKKTKLMTSQIIDLIKITCDTTIYSGQWSGLAGVCFIPHLGFGFFKKDSLIAQVNVCFLCSGIRTRPYYKSDELTITGRQKFYELAKRLDMEIVDGKSKLTY